MKPWHKGAMVLAVQLLLVLSGAAKYAWERHTCPMVWTRTAQIDPDMPLRGRYLSLTLQASACGLPKGEDGYTFGGESPMPAQTWRVQTIARDGKLATQVMPLDQSQNTSELTLGKGRPCGNALLGAPIDFFISESAKTPFPLAKGQELWALVTVPPSGPPRPVQLAVSDGHTFAPLDLR